MTVLFGDRSTDYLTSFHHQLCKKKNNVSSTHFSYQRFLLPTESLAKFYSFRLYCQIMAWIGKDIDMNFCKLGVESIARSVCTKGTYYVLLYIVHQEFVFICWTVFTSLSVKQNGAVAWDKDYRTHVFVDIAKRETVKATFNKSFGAEDFRR